MSGLFSSAESVVLPVPLSPKNIVTSPSAPTLQPECRLRIPRFGSQ
jgi:hypothetical protein